MDRLLRSSAAHVLVADVAAPVLDDPALHHLRRVLRLRDGDPVTVTDGAGAWRPCALSAGGVAPVGDVVVVTRPDPVLTLAVAPPKGERLDRLVAKVTELGVDRIVLIEAERSVVRPREERLARQLARLRRIATEAAAQSRRVWLPTIDGPEPAAWWVTSAAVAEPDGAPVGPDDTVIAVGPEGGWSPAELALARRTVALAPTVLRVETAAVAAVALMAVHRVAREAPGASPS